MLLVLGLTEAYVMQEALRLLMTWQSRQSDGGLAHHIMVIPISPFCPEARVFFGLINHIGALASFADD
jgi:hypothetical protein